MKKALKDRLIKIADSMIFVLLFIQIIRCQMKKNLPEFGVEISSPATKYRIEPIYDKIKILEGVHAGLPYGGSSGRWGDSGKAWTPQRGTPIGADITYYSGYEDVYYRLNVDFPIDTIKDYMERAYARLDDLNGETQEYKRLGRGHKSSGGESYDSFSDLVFGFAPKGMVVVWLNFGITRIELGKYKSTIISDNTILEKVSKKHLAMYRITPERFEEEKKELRIPNASSEKWDNYRNRYHWRPVVNSENPKLEVIQIYNSYYNGEEEQMLRPWVLNPAYKERAIPSEINVVWLTSKNEADKKQAFIYLNWEKANQAFLNAGSKLDLEIKISAANTVELLLNGQSFHADSIRVFDWSSSMLNGMMYKNVK